MPAQDVKRLDSLTSLRFVAALAVFSTHAAAFYTYRTQLYSRFTQQGSCAVSFFFILSGFVLAWSYRSDDTALSFYRRRFARIYPLLALAILGGVYVTNLGTDPIKSVIVPVFAVLQAWSSDPKVYWGINSVTWSLSCEAFFYAVFPVAAAFISTRSIRAALWVATACIIGAVAIPVLAHNFMDVNGQDFGWATYIAPPARLFEFVLGMALAVAMRQGWRPPLSLPSAAVLTLCAYCYAGWVDYWFRWVAVTIVPFAVLIAAAADSDLQGKKNWLSQRWAVTLGGWSYAFYLFHILFVKGAIHFYGTTTNRLLALERAAICLVLAVTLAAFLYKFVEMPLERRLRGSQRKVRQQTKPVGAVEPAL